jgi:hypothetical protein
MTYQVCALSPGPHNATVLPGLLSPTYPVLLLLGVELVGLLSGVLVYLLQYRGVSLYLRHMEVKDRLVQWVELWRAVAYGESGLDCGHRTSKQSPDANLSGALAGSCGRVEDEGVTASLTLYHTTFNRSEKPQGWVVGTVWPWWRLAAVTGPASRPAGGWAAGRGQ